jgi:pilus assembly protein CpaB
MGRRTLLLIAALVVAALGTALVFIYVNNYTGEVDDGQVRVEVLVATQDVAAGTTAADASAAGAFEVQETTRDLQAPGAISDISLISDEVALAPIFTGQQIQTQMFGSSGGDQSPLLNVPENQIAISVQLGDPNRVAGFVEPGSEVAVFASVESNGEPETRVLLDKADVIAVGATTLVTQTTTTDEGEQTTEEIPRAILTLALSQKDAQRVIFAQEQGPLYFALLPKDSSVKAGPPTNEQNLFN